MEKQIVNVLRQVEAPMTLSEIGEEIGVELEDRDFQAALRNLMSHRIVRVRLDEDSDSAVWELS